MHISPSDICQTCDSKLLQCDIRIVSFVRKIQEAFPDCHVAVGFRDQADQHLARVSGLSSFDWPNSNHNRTVSNQPCSSACDLFQLDRESGHALFRENFYQTIWEFYEGNKESFEDYRYNWGGLWIHLKDFDHFEVLD